jgi:hypothetical protein
MSESALSRAAAGPTSVAVVGGDAGAIIGGVAAGIGILQNLNRGISGGNNGGGVDSCPTGYYTCHDSCVPDGRKCKVTLRHVVPQTDEQSETDREEERRKAEERLREEKKARLADCKDQSEWVTRVATNTPEDEQKKYALLRYLQGEIAQTNVSFPSQVPLVPGVCDEFPSMSSWIDRTLRWMESREKAAERQRKSDSEKEATRKIPSVDFSRLTPPNEPVAADFSNLAPPPASVDADFSGLNPVSLAGRHACAASGCQTKADKLRQRLQYEEASSDTDTSAANASTSDAPSATDSAQATSKQPPLAAKSLAGWPRDDGHGMEVIHGDDPNLDAIRTACNASPETEFLPFALFNSQTGDTKDGFVCGLRSVSGEVTHTREIMSQEPSDAPK